MGERCVLSGCVVGRRVRVGKGAVLRDVEVQGGFVVEEGVEVKGEKMMAFEALEEEDGEGEGEEGKERERESGGEGEGMEWGS